MAKKVRFRLWFHKLNIKRFSNTSHPIKRRSFLFPPAAAPHPLDILGFSATSSSPLQLARHSTNSSPDHISVSLLSSPCHSLPVTFSSPRLSLPTTFCSPRHSLPATSLPRHGRKAFKPSKPANFSSSVLLSPINCKALDIAYPSGGSSPAAYTTLMQSPTLQATGIPATSPSVNVLSPPIRKLHTVLFKSPLHPFAHQNSEKPSIEPKMISASHGRDAQILEMSSSKLLAETSVNSCNGSHADCFASQCTQAVEEESHLPATRQRATQQIRSIQANSHGKQSPFIVDCGCHPSFSSSFRKTKKTLQACGSCSSNEPGVVPIHTNNHNKVGTQKYDLWGSVKSNGQSKNSIDHGRREDSTCSVLAAQDHKLKLQHKKRKKRMDAAETTAPKSPESLFRAQQEFSHTTPLMINEASDGNNREVKSKKVIENGADCNPSDNSLAFSFSTSSTRDAAVSVEARTLAWEKDFSSFTSEDTFFSSFERSRPSFSSNSSSECFDRSKLIYSKLPASSHTNVVSNDANVPSNYTLASIKRCSDDLNCSNPALISSSRSAFVSKYAKVAAISPGNSSQSFVDGHSFNKLQHKLRSMACKGRQDPLVEVSFNAVDVHEGNESVAPQGDTRFFAEAASEHPLCINSHYGMRRSSLNPLVKIKEDSCEDGSTDTVELNKARSSRKPKSSVKDLNLQEKLSLNPGYTASCHSDYYANAHTHLKRSARVRKKSTDLHKSKDRDTLGSARFRRRAHVQAKWRLSNQQIQWQSSAEDEDVDHDVGCTALSSQLMHLNLNDRGHKPKSSNRPRSRRTRDIKQKNTELINDSTKASKAASSALQNSASRMNSNAAHVDSEPCVAAQVMHMISDNTASKCEAESRIVKSKDESPNIKKQSSYANNPRLSDSVAVVKCSKDPLVDFRESMVDMIIEKQIYSAADLGELLQCFLSLNSHEHHDLIVQAFGQVWGKLFQESSA